MFGDHHGGCPGSDADGDLVAHPQHLSGRPARRIKEIDCVRADVLAFHEHGSRGHLRHLCPTSRPLEGGQ